jgi:hypothetical protein
MIRLERGFLERVGVVFEEIFMKNMYIMMKKVSNR